VTIKILLVDDEARILEVLSAMLMELGNEVKAAVGPADAVALVRQEKFDVAVVDNQLGAVNGLQLIGQLREIDPDLHCVLMTGNPTIEMAAEALKGGASDILRKPFRVEDLLIRIENMKIRRAYTQQRKDE